MQTVITENFIKVYKTYDLRFCRGTYVVVQLLRFHHGITAVHCTYSVHHVPKSKSSRGNNFVKS